MNYIIRDVEAIQEFCNAHSISCDGVFSIIVKEDGSYVINGECEDNEESNE